MGAIAADATGVLISFRQGDDAHPQELCVVSPEFRIEAVRAFRRRTLMGRTTGRVSAKAHHPRLGICCFSDKVVRHGFNVGAQIISG